MEAPHEHCASCFNLRCAAKPRAGSSSCDVAACPLACGTAFHSCKSGEHRLLCPLERVPCLNAGFGCPVSLARHRMAPHLEVCPAGLVCCTMEWNRWPVSCLDYTSRLSRNGVGGGSAAEPEQLDMALALQDQRTLLQSLKVVAMTPTAARQPAVSGTRAHNGAERADRLESGVRSSSPPPPPDSARERIANGINGLSEECYGRLYEATVETARSLAAALDTFRTADAPRRCTGARAQSGESDPGRGPLTNGLDAGDGDGDDNAVRDTLLCDTASAHRLGTIGPTAPQDPTDPNTASAGVTQRAGHMMVPEDQGAEPRFRKLQGFRHVPGPITSAIHQRGPRPGQSQPISPPWLEDRAVDTSDLEQWGCDPAGWGEMEPVSAALLYCLEESRESRRISDRVRVDGRRVDAGTQTYTFPAAILVTDTRVGDTASASACDHATPQLSRPSPLRIFRLGLGLEALEVEVPHGRRLPFQPGEQHTFSFVCGQAFRRDQFSWHSANVHADIHAGLSGWMEHRCPLAYYGCTFSQRRLRPAGQGGQGAGRVVHDGRLQAFGVRTCPGGAPRASPAVDRLSGLPMEILWHVARFLDSYSLCQLAVVSRGLRDVCSGLLQTRGVVDLQWERRLGPPPRCAVSWSVKNKVWRFSTAFSAVPTWRFSELPSMADHLRECRFNTPEPRSEPVPLPAMCTMRDRQSLHRLLRPVTK